MKKQQDPAAGASGHTKCGGKLGEYTIEPFEKTKQDGEEGEKGLLSLCRASDIFASKRAFPSLFLILQLATELLEKRTGEKSLEKGKDGEESNSGGGLWSPSRHGVGTVSCHQGAYDRSAAKRITPRGLSWKRSQPGF